MSHYTKKSRYPLLKDIGQQAVKNYSKGIVSNRENSATAHSKRGWSL